MVNSIFRNRLFYTVLAVSLVGCSAEELPYTDNSQDPMAYARDVKMLVSENASKAKRASEPLEYIEPLLSELKQTDRPRGDLKEIYEKMLLQLDSIAIELNAKSIKKPDLSRRLDEVISMAKELPVEIPSADPNR